MLKPLEDGKKVIIKYLNAGSASSRMYDHKSVEEKWVKFWEENKTFEQSVEQRPKEKQFVFYDGPPFATGLPHYGHILGQTSKDVFPRFWTMRGYRCERKWGWDCHGLPIENIAEKALGLKEKKDIEKMGVAKFNEFCRSKVLEFVSEWKKTVTRMGKWIDFDHSWKTMDNSYMETIWHLLKKLYEEKYIYEGKKVLMYCPQCETPLANAEIQMDNSYRDVTEKSVTVKFKLKDEENTYLLAWTTTPWTLIGNVALAVNEDLVYAKVKLDGEFVILAKDLVKEIMKDKGEIVETYKGQELIGKEYEVLYHQPSEKKGHYIINGGVSVSASEGTGIVHMAVYGEFDYEMIKKYDLPVIQHISDQGKVLSGPEIFKGLWFKDADKKVIEDLEKRQLLFFSESHTHSYPFCYRCDTPLFYNAIDSWFMDIQRIKKNMLEQNKKINWYPGHLKDGRFKNVLETAPDWNISRNRFWATALPMWRCTAEQCDHLEVIGSIKELQEKAIEEVPDDIDLHKHVMDNIHLKCSKCSTQMNRIPEVLDCWFEAGAMPYAAKHYPFENEGWMKHNFPADFISEYVGQVRTWFYYMHVLGVLVFDKAPFKHVVVTGNILAEDGKKMSKSKGNFTAPELVMDKYGADALRWYLMQSQLMKAEDISFKEATLNEMYRKVIMMLNNVKNFYVLFGKDNKTLDIQPKNILDVWIVSRLNSMIDEVTESMEAYDTITTCASIQSFIDELSTWYVRRSRDRFKSSNPEEKQAAVQTLAHVLYNVTKVMAPIAPFITEEVYATFKEQCKDLPNSVHLDSWPEVEETKINKNVEAQMQRAREVVSKVLEAREKAKIPVRQPLGKVTVTKTMLEEQYLAVIRDEVNVKEVILQEGEEFAAELDTTITPDLELEGLYREISRKVQALRKKAGLQPDARITLTIGSETAFEPFYEELQEKVGAKSLNVVSPHEAEGKGEHTASEIMKGKQITIAFDVVK